MDIATIQAERRNFDWFDPENRAESSDDFITFSGYGAKFNAWYPVYDFKERVAPKAFDKTLKENKDVVSFFNHNADIPLGRMSNGSLDVTTDARGLIYSARGNPKRASVQDVAVMIGDGLVKGASMMFVVVKDEWETEKKGGIDVPTRRTITEINLIEVGPVVLPASPTTTAKVKRMMQQTGLDIEELEGIFIKFRAGFMPQGEQSELVKRSIDTLSQLLEAEPPVIDGGHSESTQEDNSAEEFAAFMSRATELQFEMAQIPL